MQFTGPSRVEPASAALDFTGVDSYLPCYGTSACSIREGVKEEEESLLQKKNEMKGIIIIIN